MGKGGKKMRRYIYLRCEEYKKIEETLKAGRRGVGGNIKGEEGKGGQKMGSWIY